MAKDTYFSKILMYWYDNTPKRQLVWKQEKNPYHIWLSEIILQQTRVEQGTPYYLKFISKYPELTDLANAQDDELMKLWQGLGYYARARNMLKTARQIRDEYNGVFPNEYEKIRLLKGIGDYTAAAIASFAFDLPYAVLDGNVYRVISRYFGIETAIDSSSGKKIFQKIASDNLISDRSADYNQAIMDFGATICKPLSPHCINCPLAENCFAFKYDMIRKLPFKSKKLSKKNRYFYYFVFKNPEGNTIVKKRDEKDIWKSLYDFPLFENDFQLTHDNISNLWESDTWKLFSTNDQNNQFSVNFSTTYVQLLTHQKIFAIFVEISGKIPALPENDKAYKLVSLNDLRQLAFPKTIQNYYEKEPFLRG